MRRARDSTKKPRLDSPQVGALEMPPAPGTDWRDEFGLGGREPPHFFANSTAIDLAGSPVGQAHVLRRAFDNLSLDGVLCHDGDPIIYFRLLEQLDADRVAAIHRTFWNQGVAPILVLIAPSEVHVYSSLSEPTLTTDASVRPAGFVEKLERVADRLRRLFLPSSHEIIFVNTARPSIPKDEWTAAFWPISKPHARYWPTSRSPG